MVKSASESRHTAASEAKTPSSAAGNDKTVSVLPTLKDQSTSGPSSGTGSKSKIPKRSTSGADVKSPLTPDQTSMTDASGTVVSSKLQKQPGTKESLKSQSSSFEEAKGGQALSSDISPTKTAHKAGTKHIKEKSEDDSYSINLVNGVVKDHMEISVKTAHPTDGESLDVTKEGQKHLDSNVSLASNSRLPISVPTRKKNYEIPEASGTKCKKIKSSETDSDRPKTIQKQGPEQQEVSPGERPGNETPPPLPKSPKKGKTVQSQHVVC